MSKVVIFGATSAIAMEAARLFAQDGSSLFLVARDTDKLEAVGQDLGVRGAQSIVTAQADLSNTAEHAALIERAEEALGGFDTVLIAYGVLPNQKACEEDYQAAAESFQVNFLSAASLVTRIANKFEHEKQGVIAVISSAAGDRGRKSNYVYGTAKGALSLFLQGVRNRLQPAGAHVVTIKPGFVDTPMTADIKKGALFVGPDVIGRGIYKAIQKKKDIVYLPWFWCLIMLIIKHIPERIFKRLSL